MSEKPKIFNTRLLMKHDLTVNWDNSNFIGMAGEMVVYDDRYTIEDADGTVMKVPGIKICDGVNPVSKLAFTSYMLENDMTWGILGE